MTLESDLTFVRQSALLQCAAAVVVGITILHRHDIRGVHQGTHDALLVRFPTDLLLKHRALIKDT